MLLGPGFLRGLWPLQSPGDRVTPSSGPLADQVVIIQVRPGPNGRSASGARPGASLLSGVWKVSKLLVPYKLSVLVSCCNIANLLSDKLLNLALQFGKRLY